MLNLSNDEPKPHDAVQTIGGIHQQAAVWKEMRDILNSQRAKLETFLDGIYKKHDHVRVIFSGAGTSAFIGDALAPELNKQHQGNAQFEGIATTDIVSNPTSYFMKDVPTILVSFARSGNSPESVATVALGQKLVDDFYQVVITCNKDGELAANIKGDPSSITVLTP